MRIEYLDPKTSAAIRAARNTRSDEPREPYPQTTMRAIPMSSPSFPPDAALTLSRPDLKPGVRAKAAYELLGYALARVADLPAEAPADEPAGEKIDAPGPGPSGPGRPIRRAEAAPTEAAESILARLHDHAKSAAKRGGIGSDPAIEPRELARFCLDVLREELA